MCNFFHNLIKFQYSNLDKTSTASLLLPALNTHVWYKMPRSQEMRYWTSKWVKDHTLLLGVVRLSA